MLDPRGQLLRAALGFAVHATAAFLRTAIVMLAVLLGLSTSAFAQAWIGPAYVTRVVEGDFIYAMFDRRIEAVRYFGIDVPFIDHPTRGQEPYASAARQENQRLVEGRWIYLLLGTPSRDRAGRLLAYVWVDNVFVNAALVHQGYAEATSSAGQHQYLAYFRELEEGARRDGRGLWHYGDVLTYYRARPPEADLDTGGGHAPDGSGRVFSTTLPYIPALPPGAQSSPPPSPTIAPPGQRRSGPGTSPTYMPAPGRR